MLFLISPMKVPLPAPLPALRPAFPFLPAPLPALPPALFRITGVVLANQTEESVSEPPFQKAWVCICKRKIRFLGPFLVFVVLKPWSHKPTLLNGRFGNCKIGGCKEARQPFANSSPTLCQPFANPSPTFRPFANLFCQRQPTPLQAPLSVDPRHAVETWVNGRLFGQRLPIPVLMIFYPRFFVKMAPCLPPPNRFLHSKKAEAEMTPKSTENAKRGTGGGGPDPPTLASLEEKQGKPRKKQGFFSWRSP